MFEEARRSERDLFDSTVGAIEREGGPASDVRKLQWSSVSWRFLRWQTSDAVPEDQPREVRGLLRWSVGLHPPALVEV